MDLRKQNQQDDKEIENMEWDTDTQFQNFSKDPYEDPRFLAEEAEKAAFFATFERTGTYPF